MNLKPKPKIGGDLHPRRNPEPCLCAQLLLELLHEPQELGLRSLGKVGLGLGSVELLGFGVKVKGFDV